MDHSYHNLKESQYLHCKTLLTTAWLTPMYVYPTALHNFVTSKQSTIKSLCYSHTQKQFVYILGVHGSLITVSSKRIIMHAYIKKLSKLHIWKKTCWKRYMQVTIFPWTSEIQNFCQEHLWNSKISIFSGGKTMNRQICVKDFERWHVNKINKCELNFSRW